MRTREANEGTVVVSLSHRLPRRLMLVAAAILSLVALLAPAPAAQAQSAKWKMLGAVGPTNLPPQQSEVQRIIVEASGGTFTLSQLADAEATPVVRKGHLTYLSGATTATIVDGVFEIGARVSGLGSGIPANTVVASCSSDCATPGSTVTLSHATTAEKTNREITIMTRELVLSGVSGIFSVGDPLTATPESKLEAGTAVAAVNGTTLTLSKPPVGTATAKFPVATSETSSPIAFDAPADVVRAALEALPVFAAPGSITVSGGPGGITETPYFVTFGGALANRDIRALSADGSALSPSGANVQVFTTVPGGPGTGEILALPTNIGALPTSGVYKLQIGPLPPGIVTSGPAHQGGGEPDWTCKGPAGSPTISCEASTVVPSLSPSLEVAVPVQVSAAAAPASSTMVRIEGGNAGSASYTIPITVSATPAPPGIQAYWAGAFDGDGAVESQAGGHPFSAQTYFMLNTVRSRSGRINPAGDSRDVIVDLPPGFLGAPLATPRCPQAQVSIPGSLGSSACNGEMVVGRFGPSAAFFGGAATAAFGAKIFNDVPATGTAAEFTTKVVTPQVGITGSARSFEDFGIRIEALNTPTFSKVYGAYAALEGFPAGGHGKAFLRNPTDCAEQARKAPLTTFSFDTWQDPGKFTPPVAEVIPPVDHCELLEFHPGFAFEPSSASGSSPVGATARLHVPQGNLTGPGLATPDLKKTIVTLPQGLNVNPSSANGLEACSEAQMGYRGNGFEAPNPIRFDESPVSCPDGSKLGTVEVFTPLLEEKLEGTIYLGAQEANPFNSLIALYLVIESPRFGLTLKLAGEVTPNPVTGQLTAVFDNNPQVPFEDLVLHFRGGGPRSELATPEVCGHYETTGALTSWASDAPSPIAEPGFTVSSGCAGSPGGRRFAPSFEAGTVDPKAGAYSPMVIKVNRNDGEQEPDRLDFTLPPGLTGKLAGVPYCPESAIAAAAGRTGRSEQANPSCPAASQLGSVATSAGVGPEPIQVGGKIYLAGPYKGAPISAVVVTPAVAGPFDLGTVVIRTPLFVDLETARITAKSDPIPTILEGIPLKLRSVAVRVDRPDFSLNPTNCEPMAASADLGSSNGASATPSSRFQVGGCDKLKFKPNLKLSLKGATRRSGHPALKAVVTYPKKGAYANIARAQVGLPHSEFLDQGNLDKVCKQAELRSATCPKRSIYGHAKAWTPLLDKPLEGPVYIGVGYGHKLPDLVADLNGQVRILLHGKVDTTNHEGIRNTFEVVPDAPVSRFVLEMKGGKKYGLLENSENICRKKQRASASFAAQNGLRLHLTPLIANDCKKKGKQNRHGHSHAKAAGAEVEIAKTLW